MANEMSLRQAAHFDHNNGTPRVQKGWTLICNERFIKGISRRARIKAGVGKSGKGKK